MQICFDSIASFSGGGSEAEHKILLERAENRSAGKTGTSQCQAMGRRSWFGENANWSKQFKASEGETTLNAGAKLLFCFAGKIRNTRESERNFIKLYALDDEFPPTLCVCCSETVFRFIKLRFKLYWIFIAFAVVPAKVPHKNAYEVETMEEASVKLKGNILIGEIFTTAVHDRRNLSKQLRNMTAWLCSDIIVYGSSSDIEANESCLESFPRKKSFVIDLKCGLTRCFVPFVPSGAIILSHTLPP